MRLIIYSTANKREVASSSTSFRHERRFYGIAALLLLTLLLSLPQAEAAVGDTFTDSNFTYKVLTEEGSAGTVSVAKQSTSIPSGDVEIPESVSSGAINYQVTTIAISGFYGCTSLASIVIPNSVTSIGSSSFANCSGLTSVIMGDNVTTIGSLAFMNCTSLTSVIIGASVSSIKNSAFGSCTSLTFLDIPASVTSIESSAFGNCSSLYSIYFMGDAPTFIGGVFGMSPTTIYYLEGKTGWKASYGANPAIMCSGWLEIDSVRYVYFGDQTASVSGYRGFPTEISILSQITVGSETYTVTLMNRCAFGNCSSLTSIVIPDSVTSMGDSVFSGCSSLTSIELPKSITSIGAGAFSDCSSLISMELPDGVATIGESAFSNCSSLASMEFPDSVISIGQLAFHSCRSLTSVYFKGDAPTVSNVAFTGSLAKVYYLEEKNGWKSTLGGRPTAMCAGWLELDSVLYVYFKDQTASVSGYKGLLNDVSIPSSISSGSVSYTITSIREYVFNNCSGLTSIEIPESVSSIGPRAFHNCSSLVNINVSAQNENYSSLNGVLFNKEKTVLVTYPIGRTSEQYIIPENVTTIGDDAFYGCSSLTSIEIPENVTTIGDSAFYGCTSLASAYFKGDAPTLGTSAFDDAPATIYYLEGKTGWEETYGGRPTAIWVPELASFDISVGFDPENPGDLLMTVEAKVGDQFTMEFSGDLGGVWDLSAEEYVVSEDGPYVIRIPQTEEHAKYFRLKRTR